MNYEQIAVLAYRLWEERGCPDGSAEADWERAEATLRESGEPQIEIESLQLSESPSVESGEQDDSLGEAWSSEGRAVTSSDDPAERPSFGASRSRSRRRSAGAGSQ